jgi:hemolysin III
MGVSAPDRSASLSPATPRWRGKLHQTAYFAAVPAGVLLVSLARSGLSKFATAIYALSLVGLFGASAVYHLSRGSPHLARRLKRLDHSMIFVLIAGTYTPFSLLVLHRPWSVAVLVVAWSGAAAGIALKLLNVDGLSGVTGTLYIALGWLGALFLPQAVREMSTTAVALLVAGGLLYTVGAIVLLRRRPDPNPLVFGYHEVWHSLVIAAGACHYVMILLVTLSAR